MTWQYPKEYDVIVIGGGHAGCEAAHAAAQMGSSTLLLTMNLDTIAKMSCNPAIGGIGKGHMVREIDAMGGIMGKAIDQTGIQFRMLNATKGPAVWAPRAQADKVAYQFLMKKILEETENLDIVQGTTEEILVEDQTVKGVKTKEGVTYRSKTVILSAGTFMRGLIHLGQNNFSAGRAGDQAATGISKNLIDLGFNLSRLKTGTPPRVNAKTIDFSKFEEQPGEEGVSFSFDPIDKPRLKQVSCYIAYTNSKTHQIIQDNMHLSPLYNGQIQSIGPRYCPSIEDKIVRFSDKERHQLFLEPEGLDTQEIYVNGISTSLPIDVQYEMIRSIEGFENAHISRAAYAIEYDYATSGQVNATLETKSISGLYFAGQINGTTGYEEASAQGLIAAINACLKVQNRPPFILKRSEAYIGVMIDDLIRQTLTEPYRMFTSRAEYRLLLRQDNADFRLRDYGHQLGLISQTQKDKLDHKRKVLEETIKLFSKTFREYLGKSHSLAKIISRPEVNYQDIMKLFPNDVPKLDPLLAEQLELHFKYEGYIKRQHADIQKLDYLEDIKLPTQMDFKAIIGLRNEAVEKLGQFKPQNLGQASRIEGVSPADISVLMVALK